MVQLQICPAVLIKCYMQAEVELAPLTDTEIGAQVVSHPNASLEEVFIEKDHPDFLSRPRVFLPVLFLAVNG